MNINDLGHVNYVQGDGAVWKSFYDKERDPDHHYLIVTSAGRELFVRPELGHQALRGLFSDYRKAELGDREVDTRTFIGAGQQARVFGMNDKLAVREVRGVPRFYTALSDLQRMDRLASVVEGGLPRWIDTPKIYAMYGDSELNRQYTLMQKIDSGLTVEDIVTFEANDEVKQNRALAVLGRKPSNEEIETTEYLFNRAKTILDAVISAHGQEPTEILTDWVMRNVLVEPLKTPVGGQKTRLHIIDQN